MNVIQEAVAFTSRKQYLPMRLRYANPVQKKDVSMYIITDSYEYDIEMIKKIPAPKIDYKNILIPYRVIDKFKGRIFRFLTTQNEYNNKVMYMNKQRLLPVLTSIRYPYPKTIENNLYIPMSDILKAFTPVLRAMNVQVIRDNIYDIFNQFMSHFSFSKTRVILIDTTRYKIYSNPTMDSFKSDLINALLASYIYLQENKIKKLHYTIIFRGPEADYSFDLSSFEKRDVQRLRLVLKTVGVSMETSASTNDEAFESIDDFDDEAMIDDTDDISIEEDSEDDDASVGMDNTADESEEVENLQNNNKSATNSIRSSITNLSAKFGKTDIGVNKSDDSLYKAKSLKINAELIHRINPDVKKIGQYESIADDLKSNKSSQVIEDKIIDDASKQLSSSVKPSNTRDVINTTSSAREQQIRQNVGQLKLNDVSFDTITSITDTPIPQPQNPTNITSINPGTQQGTSFPNISKTYEDTLMDRDIITTFMNLSKLPGGFFVTNVEVTDVSTVTSLTNNWRVTLKNKLSDKQSVINIRVPKVINGRFYNNGIWYNIGKQDFPIPILKINKKKVILTSNYQKITVNRYDTRSLVDLSMFVKTIDKSINPDGSNKYVKVGSSAVSNKRYISTIEFDEFASRYYSFINKEANCEVYFNRDQCLKMYSFVSVKPNEFCCGMINQVPIVLNTDTGLTRDNRTITATMLSTLPADLQASYSKIKPGKLSMYTEITIGVTIPLGVAIAAWEGLSSLIKRANCKYQYVDNKFNDTNYILIRFKDKTLAIDNSINNQLLFNGFFRINTKSFNVSDFESPIMETNSVFVDIFNQIFFKQYSQLTTFITYYNFFVDAITADVCLHYNIPNDICGMLIYASNLLADNNCGSENNTALYRIRSSEIIPAIIHYRLAFALSKFNNQIGSKSKGSSIVFNPNEVINELIQVNNVETASALNPIVELHSKENITKKGFKGVNDDRAYSLDKRTYDDSMIGKMGISSPNNGTVGITRQLVADPKIDSVRGYTSTNGVDADYNDLQLASFSELLTPGTVSRDDAIRTAIATSQSAHLVSTDGAEPVIVSNGVDELVPAYLSDEFAVVAKTDGKVIEIADGYMIVQYVDNTKRAIPINDRYSFNSGSGFFVNNKLTPNFEEGDTFKQNDILAYHNKFFHKDVTGTVRMNVGPMAKVAFTGIYSTYEDGGIITKSMSKKLSTHFGMRQISKLNVTDDVESIVKVGDEIEIGDPLIVFGLGDTGDKSVDNFLKAFQTGKEDGTKNVLDSAKRVVKSKYAGYVTSVKMYTIKSLDKLSPSLFNIFDEYFKENMRKRKILDKHDNSNSVYKMETLYDLPTEPIKGSSIKGINCDILIEIIIGHEDEVSVGDKLVAYAASKQINSEVVPEGLEPYAESAPDEEISMFINPFSIMKRMIPSIMITASANSVQIELKKQIRKLWNS